MLTRATLIVLLLASIITFADWFSSPVQLCEPPLQQHSETGKGYENTKEYCSAGKVVAFWRSLGRAVDSWHDDLTAAATIVIAIFTTILGIFTVNLAQSTRVAADAAKEAGEAAVRIELPILTFKQTSLRLVGAPIGTHPLLNPSQPIPEKFDPIITFNNLGRSPAQITSGCLEWYVADKASSLPRPPRYQNIAPYSPGVVLAQNGYIHLDVPCVIQPTVEQLSALNSFQQSLWVYGYLAYKDFLGKPHEHRFCIKWSRYRDGEKGPFGFVWDSDIPAEYTSQT